MIDKALERGPMTRRGFTLLEIMISVLILGLGLLGIGALFPVVIRSQRVAQDETYGAMAADTAIATIKAMDFESALPTPRQLPPRRIWPFIRGYYDTNGVYQFSHMGGQAYQHGQWFIPSIDNITNTVELGATTVPERMELPVSARLYPQGSPNLAPPQFVWDLAVQRIDDGVQDTNTNPVNNAATDGVRVALFVRRLDLRMRPPSGGTIYAAIADDSLAAAQRLRPVGVAPATGLPSGDGTGDYAAPITLPVELRLDSMSRPERDRLYLGMGITTEQWAIVRQLGQKLVDNLGNIHTVTGSVESGGDRYVTLEGSVPTSVTTAIWPDGTPLLHEVVLTPQVPVAVRVFRVE